MDGRVVLSAADGYKAEAGREGFVGFGSELEKRVGRGLDRRQDSSGRIVGLLLGHAKARRWVEGMRESGRASRLAKGGVKVERRWDRECSKGKLVICSYGRSAWKLSRALLDDRSSSVGACGEVIRRGSLLPATLPRPNVVYLSLDEKNKVKSDGSHRPDRLLPLSVLQKLVGGGIGRR